MSLRVRLLLLVVLLNLSVVGVVQVISLSRYKERLQQQQVMYRTVLQAVLADAYPEESGARWEVWVREFLLKLESFRTQFRDVMVSGGGAAGAEGVVDLNPMGAAHPSRHDVSLAEVRAGIRRAKREQREVPVGDGFCVPIRVGGEMRLGAWYVPVELATTTAFEDIALPVFIGTVLIAVLGYIGLGTSLKRPLETLGRAAARVGAGEYGVKVAPVARTPELNVLVDAFNSMADKVAGHTEELRREVQRATEETARRERALIVSSRLAAMGTLAAGIAHEINNPIGGMLNAARRLRQRDDLDERSEIYLDLILEGLDRVGATARKVLDFSPRQIEAAPFRLVDSIRGAHVFVEHRCEREEVELDVSVPEDLPDLTGDRHEMQQVVLNCLLNSLDVLEKHPRPRRIHIDARRDGDWIVLQIDDNGPGADAETLSRVLDPFFSAKGVPTASGLGLFISYSIVKNHGGEFEVESRVGEGFRVRIRLPVDGRGPPEPADAGSMG